MTGSQRFHESTDYQTVLNGGLASWQIEQCDFDFENFFHPLVGQLIAALNHASGDAVAAMLDPTFLAGLANTFFSAPTSPGVNPQYTPGDGPVHITSYPAQIDLDHQLPYANYNWELIYHIPVAVAVHLSQNQRFAEAQQWFHYVFDPTSIGPGPAPARFWKCLYFQQNPQSIDLSELFVLLSSPQSQLTSTQISQVQDLLTSYATSVSTPFSPFAVARSRPIAFQYYVVMKYLDNLIAWGDSLYSQMTIETVNEATLCYVIAANLLGPQPQPVPAAGTTSAKCYNDLLASGTLDKLGDALVALEGQFPFNITTPADNTGLGTTGSAFGAATSLYFCIPPNSKLLGYWSTVEGRLNQIRHCENLAGQVQLMPLFDPPIDPNLLVAATAAGLDVGSVLSGLNQPVSPVRAPLIIQKALELCGEVRSLGAGLLAAIEKSDAEALARLRQNNEVSIQQMSQNLRFLQWQQAQASTEALLRSRASALERYTFYLRELGGAPDPTTVPDTFTVDHTTVLTEDNFNDAYDALVTQYDRTIATQTYPNYQPVQSNSPSAQSGASGSGNLYLSSNEDDELNDKMPNARDLHVLSEAAAVTAAALAPVPDLRIDVHFWGLGATSKVGGGGTLATVANAVATGLRTLAQWEQDQGAMAGRKAGYQRRADDWQMQINLAAHELSQLGRQILVSLLTEQSARAEYETAKTQVGQAQEVLSFLQTKFTNTDLYGWMQGQLSSLYYQYYRMALDTARKAEATTKWELMRPEVDAVTYIQPTYWDSGHQGLLAGEALYRDIKSLDLDYQTYHLRELEMICQVSLRQLDPLALLQLITTGSAMVTIPEWFYDRGCPGQFMRRMKMLRINLAAVAARNTNVNVKVTLQNSSVRTTPDLLPGNTYARSTNNADPRFVDYYGSTDTVVTSNAVADSGMFETNLRDERFLPFEGAGAISTWSLSLPDIPSFDYSTITDVVLEVYLTARDGGQALADAAGKYLKTLPPGASASEPTPTLAVLLNLRHDFPNEWYTFTSGTNTAFSATLTMDYFPYLVQNAVLTIESIGVYAGDGDTLTPAPAIPVPPTMSTELNTNRSTTLSLPADPNVLAPTEPTRDVYAIITYTAKLPAQ